MSLFNYIAIFRKKKHLILFKQLGRVNNILKQKVTNKNTIEILVLNEKISIQFNENIDLASRKQGIIQKLANLEKQSKGLKNKLAFIGQL